MSTSVVVRENGFEVSRQINSFILISPKKVENFFNEKLKPFVEANPQSTSGEMLAYLQKERGPDKLSSAPWQGLEAYIIARLEELSANGEAKSDEYRVFKKAQDLLISLLTEQGIRPLSV